MQTQDTAATIISLAKLEAEPNGVYKRWEDEITFAEKEMGKFWKAARLTIRRYIDDRDATEVQKRWFNAFFTNVGIMEASLYDQTPEASVSRRFLDMNDDDQVAEIARAEEAVAALPDTATPAMRDYYQATVDFMKSIHNLRPPVRDALARNLRAEYARTGRLG